MILQLEKRGLNVLRIGLWRQDAQELGFEEEQVREEVEKKERVSQPTTSRLENL